VYISSNTVFFHSVLGYADEESVKNALKKKTVSTGQKEDENCDLQDVQGVILFAVDKSDEKKLSRKIKVLFHIRIASWDSHNVQNKIPLIFF